MHYVNLERTIFLDSLFFIAFELDYTEALVISRSLISFVNEDNANIFSNSNRNSSTDFLSYQRNHEALCKLNHVSSQYGILKKEGDSFSVFST